MHNNIQLLTGIPRSGTTLCCKLLNSCDNTFALHEPIDPSKLNYAQLDTVATQVDERINALYRAIQQGEAFEHGHNGGLELDNPVGQTVEKGIRQLSATRGMIQLQVPTGDFKLIVKQNALFTALSHSLPNRYHLTAIVRNPIDVLLSWMEVDLPVNRGRLPAGERVDKSLATKLKQGNTLSKQIVIYRWFVESFTRNRLPVIKYEDIISSQGKVLFSHFNVTPNNTAPYFEHRKKAAANLQILQKNATLIIESLANQWYSAHDIETALARH